MNCSQPRRFWLTLISGLVLSTGLARGHAADRYRVAYATYLGGAEFDQLREVIAEPDGSVLVGGITASSDLLTTRGALQWKYAGDDPASGHPGIVGGDAYLARLDSTGGKLLAATYFGGSKQERGVYGMAIDPRGDIVIVSATRSADLPTTPGCFQPTFGGAPADAYVAKISLDLKDLRWCTYLGGSRDDWPRGGLALDPTGNILLVGGTDSPDYPTTPGAFQQTLNGDRDALVSKLSSDGSRLLMSTLIGGSGWDGTMGIRVGRRGDLFIAGHTQSTDFPLHSAAQPVAGGKSDCYVARFSGDGGKLIYSSYLGGEGNEFAEHRLALTADGSVLVSGVTASADFPTTADALQRDLRGATDGFLAKVAADGRTWRFSTLLGGEGGDFFLMPTIGPRGNIYLVGATRSADFPVTPDALQLNFGGNGNQPIAGGDGVLAILSPDGRQLVYATYLGGRGDDLIRSMVFGRDGAIYLVGSTSSDDFPVTRGALQTALGGKIDAFVVKLVAAR